MNSFRYKYYVIGFLLLTFFILSVSSYIYYYYYYSSPNQISGTTTQQRSEEFRSLSGLSPDTISSTIENENIILQKIDASLANEEMTDEMRNLLLIQKARRLISQSSGTMDKNKYFEAMEILGSMNERLQSRADEDPNSMLRYTILNSQLQTLELSCFLTDLGEKLPAPYDAEYRDFMAKGYSPKASVILAFRSLAYNSSDPTLPEHILTIARRVFLSAIYLDAFGKEHTDLDTDIFNALKKDLQLYRDLLERMNDGKFLVYKIYSAFQYAYAYDIVEMYEATTTTLDQEKNRQIDVNYENAIDLAEEISSDPVVQHINMSFISMFYLESLHRRYTAEDLDAEKVSNLIDMYIESASYSKETKNSFGLILGRGVTDEGRWLPVRIRFFEVAKKYPKLKDFIENLAGITL